MRSVAEHEVLEAQRKLDDALAAADVLHHRAIAGDAVVLLALDTQLLQERRHAGHRPATGQHHLDALRAGAGDGLHDPGRQRVRGIEQGPIHVDGDQFDRAGAVVHIHGVRRRGAWGHPV